MRMSHGTVPKPLPPLRSLTPRVLLRKGWVREEDQLLGRLATCATPACRPHCSKRDASDACGLCSCSLCSACVLAVQSWRTPAGRVLYAASTASEPQFTFAFSRDDSDMRGFLRTQLVEPALTLAWHNATRACCASGGTIVDVGCNYGWYTLYSLALGCQVTCFEPVPEWRDVIRLGVALNPGFQQRLRVVPKLAYHLPENFTLRVPRPQTSTDDNETCNAAWRRWKARQGWSRVARATTTRTGTWRRRCASTTC